jgi:hypothetical protein
VASQDPEDPSTWLSLDVVYDRVLAQLDAQSERWESADGRLRLILGLIGVVFAITSSFVTRGVTITGAGGVAELLYLPFVVGAPLVLGMLVFLVAGLIAIVAYWPLRFERPPEPADLRDAYLTTEPRMTKLVIIDTILQAYDVNEQTLQRKLRAFKLAIVLSVIATGFFGSAVIIQLLSITRAVR